jgi:hypothetical protein
LIGGLAYRLVFEGKAAEEPVLATETTGMTEPGARAG